MFGTNPFAELSALLSPEVIQTYVIIMFLLVVAGTIFDVIHKKSAKYFSEASREAKEAATRTLSGGEKASLAMQTVASEVLTSSEFCNPRRRIAHLLTMYGFVLFVLTTAILVFYYPTDASGPAFWSLLWHLGALMICIGGYWFWFFIRVDVAAEGHSPFDLSRADLFIVSLLGMATFALLWSIFKYAVGPGFWSYLFMALLILSATVLFAGVPWSKFAHMFFKPAAAFQKRVIKADGSRENLPAPADRPDPATRDRHSMELLKDAPLEMGLGIKREPPRHY